MPKTLVPPIESLLISDEQYKTIKDATVQYTRDNRPSTAVKKTYRQVCEESNLNPQIEYVYKPTAEDLQRFVKANSVVAEKNQNDKDDSTEVFEMPPPSSLFFNN